MMRAGFTKRVTIQGQQDQIMPTVWHIWIVTVAHLPQGNAFIVLADARHIIKKNEGSCKMNIISVDEWALKNIGDTFVFYNGTTPKTFKIHNISDNIAQIYSVRGGADDTKKLLLAHSSCTVNSDFITITTAPGPNDKVPLYGYYIILD